jgi:acyl-CoA dehydrogenase family protein 9
VGKEEFFLRRVTTLSYYTYGLLALLAKMEADQKAGSSSEKDLHLLEFFMEEAKEVRKMNNRVWDSRKESLISRIGSIK